MSQSTLALDHVKLTQQQILGGLGLKWWQNKIASHKTHKPPSQRMHYLRCQDLEVDDNDDEEEIERSPKTDHVSNYDLDHTFAIDWCLPPA